MEVNIVSDHLDTAEYDEDTQVLTITFKKNGRTYKYDDVPLSTVRGLESSASADFYFRTNIKHRYRFYEV